MVGASNFSPLHMHFRSIPKFSFLLLPLPPNRLSLHSRFATDAETYLIAPTLKLVNSRQPSTREDGLYRLINWHGSDATLPAIVERDGVEALLNALPHVKAASRVIILEMLQRMVPLEDARARMLSQNAAERAATACAALERSHAGGSGLLVGGPSPDPAAAKRCDELAAALAQALQATQPASSI